MITQAQHTPGPWTVLPLNWGAQVLARRKNTPVCAIGGDTEDPREDQEALANARLIAAAPEMLAALRKALSLIEAISDGRIAEVHGDIDETGSLVCDAIAKAAK